jgi:hypothetical protein
MAERGRFRPIADQSDVPVQARAEASRLEIGDLFDEPIPEGQYGAGRTLTDVLDEVLAIYETDDQAKLAIRNGYETQLRHLIATHGYLGEALTHFEKILEGGGIRRDNVQGIYYWSSK